MKTICNLNSLKFISDYKEIGVDALIVGNDEVSSRNAISLQLEEIATLTKDFNVYMLLNLLYSEKELPLLEKWLIALKEANIKGVFFQDFAVLNMVQEMQLPFEMVYAPETLNTNHQTLDDLKNLGIHKAFLSRELSLNEIESIALNTKMPLIIQIHGVMYMGQSKRQLLSNYAKSVDLSLTDPCYVLKAKDSDLEAWIYQDQHGCNIVTKDELTTLELLPQLNIGQVEYGFIDTLMMDEFYALDVISIYQDAINSLENGQFSKEIHEYRPLLAKLMKDKKASTGFYQNENTVYKLEDVRVRDNEKRN